MAKQKKEVKEKAIELNEIYGRKIRNDKSNV